MCNYDTFLFISSFQENEKETSGPALEMLLGLDGGDNNDYDDDDDDKTSFVSGVSGRYIYH